MKKAMLFFSLFLATTKAFAAEPPGPPPWHCTPSKACDGDSCVDIPGAIFEAKLIEVSEKLFRIEGQTAVEQAALLNDDPKRALEIISNDFPDTVSLYLKPSDKVADAHGFELYSVGIRGGEHIISESHVLISCNSINRY